MERLRNFVGGEWLDQGVDSTDINPSDVKDVIAEYARADSKVTADAIEASSNAANKWGTSNVQERADILDSIGDEILNKREILGKLLSREEGKTLPEGIGEVTRAGNIFKFFAGEALRLTGDLVPSVRSGVDVEVIRQPVGVVGIIAPWNFPAAIPAWKIAPALAFGNSVVFKPANLVPAMAFELAKIIGNSDLPPGVFNFVMGKGGEVGETIVNDERVNALSFTGSRLIQGRKLQKKQWAEWLNFSLKWEVKTL